MRMAPAAAATASPTVATTAAPATRAGPLAPSPVELSRAAAARSSGVASRRARFLAIVFGAWALVALVTTQQAYYTLTRSGQRADWRRLLAVNLASCFLWALFTPAIVWLTRRYPVHRLTWRGAVPRHLAFAVAFHLADSLIQLALPALFGGGAAPLGVVLARHTFLNLSCYLIVVALTSAADYARMYREHEVAAARLAEQLSAARLHVLQSQLRPHFLFNTLNTIAEQVHSDPFGADRTIMRLSALLRASFAEGDEVPLRTELEVVESYVDIMAVRFAGRVEVSYDVEPAALDALVPRFLLQPLVENALRHGIEPLERGGRVEVVARARDGVLALEVRDSGRGLPATAAVASLPRQGVGLRNTRDRLRQLYGDAYGLTLRPRTGGGAVVAVTVPHRVRDEESASRAVATPAAAR